MTEHDHQPAPKKRSKIVSIITWMIVVLMIPACGSWIIGRSSYAFDLISSQQMLIGWAALMFAVLMLIARQWRAGICMLLLGGLSLYPVLIGRLWVLNSIDTTTKLDNVFRVVSCNLYPNNESWEEDLATLFSYDADVVVIIEVPILLNRMTRNRQYLDTTLYPHWAHRAWVDDETSPGFIVSRWAMDRIISDSNPSSAQHRLFMQVHSPAGEVIVGLMHPLSPRSPSRWIDGNRAIDSQSSAAWMIEKQHALPVIIGADLNAGPAQKRARALRHGGLTMSKPVFRLGGSYPAESTLPMVLRPQLDDVWSNQRATPIAWDMIELKGSDHRAVVVDFRLSDH